MIHTGDMRHVLATLEADRFDSVVTDPPYGLGFMDKDWDHAVPGVEFWRQAMRVAKPGAYLVAFGGTRTFHRLMVAIEDAGWEIRDTLMWVYGSGMPKSFDLGKAAGPAHEGWGSSLKPAWEPIVLARKPFAGTLTTNVLQHGVGGLHIAACRIPTDDSLNGGAYAPAGARAVSPALSPTGMNRQGATAGTFVQPTGRWPANLIHDGSAEVLEGFPGQAGARAKVKGTEPSSATGSVYNQRDRTAGAFHGDAGSAARFFYCGKASPAERGEGNTHPTVKPLAVMDWLCRLVTPPGGEILDPFTGSGTTGEAAIAAGFRFFGVELTAEHAATACRRVLAGIAAEDLA